MHQLGDFGLLTPSLRKMSRTSTSVRSDPDDPEESLRWDRSAGLSSLRKKRVNDEVEVVRRAVGRDGTWTGAWVMTGIEIR